MCTNDNDRIGWIMADGNLSCRACAGSLVASGCVPIPVPVYVVNIRPYSQTCHSCGYLLVDGLKKRDGSGPLCLFDPPIPSSVRSAASECCAEHAEHIDAGDYTEYRNRSR